MRITHIIRGDDHVENTYRHLFLFQALGAPAPAYAHLPMIVNASGKPYSKRDGDAFVGDFRDKGLPARGAVQLPDPAGLEPGRRAREAEPGGAGAGVLAGARATVVGADGCAKLLNLNGQYMADLPFEAFLGGRAGRWPPATPWGQAADAARLAAVARLLQSRTKLWTDVAGWWYFFVDIPGLR